MSYIRDPREGGEQRHGVLEGTTVQCVLARGMKGKGTRGPVSGQRGAACRPGRQDLPSMLGSGQNGSSGSGRLV